MKIFTLIFSVYILALSCMPCSDSDDCKYEQEEQTSNFATTDHSDHEQDTESCSPFCMCACCGQSFSYEHFAADLAFLFPVSEQKISVYKTAFVSEVCFNIWQPPKIS